MKKRFFLSLAVASLILVSTVTDIAPAKVQAQTNLVRNGDFSQGLAYWAVVDVKVVTGGVKGKYPDIGVEDLYAPGNPYLYIDTPWNSEGYVEQQFLWPTVRTTLSFKVWGGVDPVEITIAVVVGEYEDIVDRFDPPKFQEGRPSPILKTYDLGVGDNIYAKLRIRCTSSYSTGTIGFFDDISIYAEETPTPTTPGLPDLTFQKVGFDKPEPFEEGDTIQFGATIVNQGYGSAYNFVVEIYLDERLYTSGTISLNASESQTLWCDSPWNATKGTHTITWIADSTNAVAESNESNNRMSRTFTVGLPRPQHGGKILFDETHNEYWESTIEQGYADLAEELRRAGFTVESLKSGPITYEKISQYDVLAIAAPFTPPKPLTSDEISAVKRFVSEGGGLFLAATGWSWVDYTNQDVGTDPANQIGREFGMTVNDDRIYDPTDNLAGDPGLPVFYLFASHPITSGLSKIWGGVPSSLKITGSAQAVVWGDEDAYARDEIETYPEGSHPPFVGAAQYGGGKVVYVANDGMFHAGPYRRDRDNLRKLDNLKFVTNTFKWLSGYYKVAHNITIVSVEAPSQVYIGNEFAINVNVQYSFSIPTRVMFQVYEHAGPLLASWEDGLAGDGVGIYNFAVAAPSSTRTWQLNIHAFYSKDGEWVQDDIKSISLSVVSTTVTASITTIYIFTTLAIPTPVSRPDYSLYFLVGLVSVAVISFVGATQLRSAKIRRRILVALGYARPLSSEELERYVDKASKIRLEPTPKPDQQKRKEPTEEDT